MSSPPTAELVKQWESEQERLRRLVVEEDTEDWQRNPGFSGLERVGGMDLSFIKGDEVNACAQLVVLSYPDLKVLYEDSQMVMLTAPYVSGFLAFRETPFLLELLQRLKTSQPALMPQVVFVDGNGLFHYREFGLACHLGVMAGLPCVGVAKNLLQLQGVFKDEEHQSQIAALQKGGDSFPLTVASGKVLGKALRSCDKSSKPVYVSVGHKISLDTAVRLTHSCCRYRVPEPVRQGCAAAFSTVKRARGRVQPSGFVSPLQQKRDTQDKHNEHLTNGYLKRPSNPPETQQCFWIIRRSLSTRREPLHVEIENANSMEKKLTRT